jgi:hypothetical protein
MLITVRSQKHLLRNICAYNILEYRTVSLETHIMFAELQCRNVLHFPPYILEDMSTIVDDRPPTRRSSLPYSICCPMIDTKRVALHDTCEMIEQTALLNKCTRKGLSCDDRNDWIAYRLCGPGQQLRINESCKMQSAGLRLPRQWNCTSHTHGGCDWYYSRVTCRRRKAHSLGCVPCMHACLCKTHSSMCI